MSTKVLVADKFPDYWIGKMKEAGYEVIYEPKLGEKDLPDAAKNVEILVVRSTNVTAETINSSKSLTLIIRAGAGVNNIAIPAANEKGIYVSNCPGKNSIAVAELAIGLMLSLDRRIPHNVIDFKKGIWNKAEYSKADGMYGKTLLLIGVGNIGKEVARRAIALGMEVYGKDIVPVEGVAIKMVEDVAKVVPFADVISMHLPLLPSTKGFFNEELFNLMKPGATLINTSRAQVIDQAALIKAVKEKNIKVGVDVFEGEPEGKTGTVASELQTLDNVYVTHHIGASTEQAQNAVAEDTFNIITNYVNSGIVNNWVNKSKKSNAKFQMVLKLYDKPGILAAVLDILKMGEINIEEISSVVFDGGEVSCCKILLGAEATPDMLKLIKENKEVINVAQVAL